MLSLLVVPGPFCAPNQHPSTEYALAVIYIQFKSDMDTNARGFNLTFAASGDPIIAPKSTTTSASSERS